MKMQYERNLKMENIQLLIIDPQIDFCEPGTGIDDPNRGTLYVDNAENDMARAAGFISRYGSKIKKIHVTLDCHHLIDVAHPPMWRDGDGNEPPIFTIITSQEIKDGVWTPYRPDFRQKFINYTEALAVSGRFPLCIWPPHCLIGSPGNAVLPILFEALMEWQRNTNRSVQWVSKGSNPLTEHYSAVKAEVPEPDDITTQLNAHLIQTLVDADKVFAFGEAGSHCVKSTVEDIADGFGNDDYVKKMVLLTDCVSPVQSPYVDFPAIQAQFIKDMGARGMQTALSTDF